MPKFHKGTAMETKMALKIGVVSFLLAAAVLWGIGETFVSAQEADPNNKTVHVTKAPDGQEQKDEFDAPGPGETLTVIIEAPKDKNTEEVVVENQEADKVIESPIDISDLRTTTSVRRNKFHVRGGLSTGGVTGTDHSKPSFSGGLIGEVYVNSVSLQGTFRAGNCLSGNGGLALNSGLALLGRVQKKVRAGVSADLLYCSDVFNNTLKEKPSERIVGGSLLLDVELANHLVVGASVGIGGATIPVLGGLSHTPVLYGGINVAYFWGHK